MSEYVWIDKVSRRTAHKKRQEEKEAQAKTAEDFLEAINAGFEAPPFKLVDGQVEERLPVAASCIGLVLGKKGANLKEVEKKFRVQVKLEGAGRNDPPGSVPEVVIRGSSYREVEAARHELDFGAEQLPVPREMVGWVCGKGNRHLKRLKELTGVAVLGMARDDKDNQTRDKDQSQELMQQGQKLLKQVEAKDAVDDLDEDGAEEDAEGDTSVPQPQEEDLSGEVMLQVKGKRGDVEDAMLCLDTHMNYYPLFMEMNKVEEDLDRQLAEARGGLGRRLGAGPRPNGDVPSKAGRGRGRGTAEQSDKGQGRGEGRGRGDAGRGGRGRGGRGVKE